MQYELFFLVGESQEPKLDNIKEDVKSTVTREGGIFQEPQISEKRKMAYKVKGEIRGTYVAERFDLPENDSDENKGINKIQNITKKMNLNQDVLRFIIVNARELPELKPHKSIVREKTVPVLFRKREERPISAPAPDKAVASKKAAAGEKTKETKSIDEKLEEILNI